MSSSTRPSALDPAPLILRGRCLPYGDGVTYWPLAEILKGHAGILDTDPPDLAVEKVRKTGRDLLTQEIAADPARATAALAYTVGLDDPEVSFEGADPREVREELHRAWTSFFTALALAGPVVVVIEDIHWADPVAPGPAEELAERVEGPVTFLCPSRPDLTATRPELGRRPTEHVVDRAGSALGRGRGASRAIAAHGGRPPALGPRAASSNGRRATPSTSRRSSGG